MGINPFSGSLGKKQWKRRGYNRITPTNRKNVKIVRFGTANKRPWRLRLAPKLRVMRLASPMKLWFRFKNAYMKMMLRISNTGNLFGDKRIPQARDAPMAYSRSEFENRLVLEIYKSMVASLELGYNK